MNRARQLMLFILLCSALSVIASDVARAEFSAFAKIDATVLKTLQQGQPARALLVMAEQADVSAAKTLPTKQAKGEYVFKTLRATAQRTQAATRAELERRGVNYRAYYVANVIAVEQLNLETATQVAKLPTVGRIVANSAVKFSAPAEMTRAPQAPSALAWNLQTIGAEKLWAQRVRGSGIVVANQDTGVQWDHPALKRKYRGYDKTTGQVRHAYQWWDAIHGKIIDAENPCGYSIAAPCDDYGHGTHTMGTLVGSTRAQKFGVAPRAKWISCRNMDQGWGRPSTYIECFEFFLAPWNARGKKPNPARAPDVVNNSWGCFDEEGCDTAHLDILRAATDNLRAAGIFVLVSAGNAGAGCASIADPSAIYDAATTVGATNRDDALATFSSRGPVTADGSNRRKPDLSAPGVNVRSSVPNNSYAIYSGTSMAAPHVAGAVALLWQAQPNLRGDVDATENLLFITANPNVSANNQICGGTGERDIPNNLFGYGRLDAWRAYQNLNATK